jgi:hypothetical protein
MRLLFVPLITLIITGCDGHYRYPCQDPANWGKLECSNEVCKAEGTCTEDVLGRKVETPAQSDNVETPVEPSSEPTAEPVKETVTPCSPVVNNEEEAPVAKLHRKKPSKLDIVMDPEGDEYEAPVRTPPSMEEEVLTMNTVVDTAAHNAAIK